MSAETGNFIDPEQARRSDDSTRMLWRFIREAPVISILLIPSLLLATVSTAGFQIFSWLSGVLTECQPGVQCVAQMSRSFSLSWFSTSWVPVTGFTLTLSSLILFAVLMVLLRIIGWILFEVGGQIACLGMFSRMMQRLTQTRTTFFDEQPSGRIINRTVRDFDQLRFLGPIRIGDALNALVELLVIGIVIGFAHPLAGLVVVPTLLLFLYIQRNIAPMLQFCIVQRSIRFGEVLHRETDCIEGIRTFLLYGQHRTLFRKLGAAMTGFTQIHLLRAKIEAWGRFWSVLSSAVCSFIALMAVAYGLEQGTLSPTFAAVVITAIFRLAGVFGWLSWSLGYLFETAGHARRIFEYIDLPNEQTEEHSSPKRFKASPNNITGKPLSGELSFKNYSMSYRADSPVILNSLNLVISQGLHVGIIGRTGAGKSSLVQALFRMVYVHGGDICIGGVSIFSIPIEQARLSFAVMPQDPYLFAGSIRENLDPLAQHSDTELKKALAECQLSVSLDQAVAEGGSNFSLGQRQLFGLTRVLLSTAPIVIMDEPTSSVDAITDALLQDMLRLKLKGRTVLTIAHRLGTLSSSDLVIELQAGTVKRFGPGHKILAELEGELAELL